MKAKKKIEIIPGCIICRTCEFHAPDLFILKEGAVEAEVLNPYPSEDQISALHEAIRMCPEKIIKFRTIKKGEE